MKNIIITLILLILGFTFGFLAIMATNLFSTILFSLLALTFAFSIQTEIFH